LIKIQTKTLLKNKNLVVGLVRLIRKSKGWFDFVLYGLLKNKKQILFFKILRFLNL